MRFSAVSPARLVELVVDRVEARPGIVRVSIDGPPATRPIELGAALVEPLRARGRPAEIVRAETFWRDRSLRYEFGREDVESYRHWLDTEALRREVLDAAADGRLLPSLRDPQTNRSTRAARRELAPSSVVLVCGAFLGDLPFDLTVALTMTPAAQRRRTPEAEHWTLPAFEGYRPDADVVVRMDDPRHPAVGAGRG